MERITHDIPDYHTTPVEAAEIAAAAGTKALLDYHIVPPLLVPGMEAAFLQGVGGVYEGTVLVGRDGTFVSMPSGSQAIQFSNLLSASGGSCRNTFAMSWTAVRRHNPVRPLSTASVWPVTYTLSSEMKNNAA